MNCAWEAKLDPYVDMELPESESNDIRAHLLTCQTCARGALARLQSKQSVRAAGRRFPPRPEFRRRIERSLARPGRGWVARWVPALAAALLLLVTGAGAFWLQRLRVDEQDLSQLADLHISTLASANPVDIVSSDRHTVKPWFQGKIPFAFNLPDLKNTSFQLIGGRVVYFHQSAGAQLLFREGKHDISVFLFQDRGVAARLAAGPGGASELTFHTETWRGGALRYVAIGDVAPTALRHLSELLKAAGRS